MIVVLADDFSGAAEIAGAALAHGLTAEVHVDHLLPSQCDVAVVDINTRSESPAVAASTAVRVARQLKEGKPTWVYNKIDSVLRGPLMATLQALRSELGYRECLLVNANPRKRRVVVDGQLLVEGRAVDKTQFAADPEHPRTTSSVVELLGAHTQQVRVVHTAAEFAQVVSSGLSAVEVIVGNCQSSAELKAYASQVAPHVLAAGAAEFFEAILEKHGFQPGELSAATLIRSRGTLIVRGTAAKQVDEPLNAGPDSICVNCGGGDVQRASEEVCRQLNRHVCVTLESAAASAAPADAHLLHSRLVDCARSVIARSKPKQLWIEGGRTASSIVRALGWQRLIAESCYADGVVGLKSAAPMAPTLVVKPGSYRWP